MNYDFGYANTNNKILASFIIHHHQNGDNTFAFHQKLTIKLLTTLYILDEYTEQFRIYGSKSLILNSIGSKYSNSKLNDNLIYSFLPSINELRMIASLIKNPKAQELFHEKRCLIGPSIRYCLQLDLSDIQKLIIDIISTIKPREFNSVVMNSSYYINKPIKNIYGLLLYASSRIPKGSDIYTYFNCSLQQWKIFSNYVTKIGSPTLTKYLKDHYFEVKENAKQILFNIMSEESHLEKLKAAFFNLDLNALKDPHPFIFQAHQLTYSIQNSKKISDETKVIREFTFNADSSEVEIVKNPELLFTSNSPVVYYLPPTVNESGIDAAYKCMIDGIMTLVLLQFTVSYHLSFHMGVFEYFKKKIDEYKSKIKLEFWVVTPHLNHNFVFDKLKGYCSDSNNAKKKTIGRHEPLNIKKIRSNFNILSIYERLFF
ncbi:hypothetical protein TRFO_28170 [Tritrichomonas foetus]|uniref:Uncharacterized protein n=1 Tax=Tritrichomonas foetus TaxID=1144522 RepID=A0A1J4JYV1_9EUKA|nr:hypothetical protein TRFO_28170 [Tritrichomonas foetus]|eukprot:OHT04343.1 hypothetical protein TRFO_28170 [Tritrichomonas foetus]